MKAKLDSNHHCERFRRTFCSTSGQSLTEVIVGGAIISISALVLGVALNQSAKTRMKTMASSNAIAIESEIVSKLQDVSVFAGQEQNLREGNLAAVTSTFALNIEGWDPLHIGEQYYTSEGRICSGFENASCAIKIKLELHQTSAGPPPQYAFGYRIETNSKMVAMAAMGAPRSTFSPEDFDLILPIDAYREGTTCPAGTLVARGISMDTGQIECLREPSVTCPANSLATGLILFGDEIRFTCTPLRVATCVNHYSPSQINPASLLTTPSGTCLFVANPTQPARTGDSFGRLPIQSASAAYGVTGRFCPDNYKSRVTLCQAIVANTAKLPAPPVGGAMPAGQWQGVSAGNVLVDPVNVGTTLKTEGTVNASCVLNNAPATQPGLPGNQAGWTGYVNMTVECDVDTAVYPLQKTVGGS